LALQPGIELVLGHGLQLQAALVGPRILEIYRHVDGIDGHKDLVYLLPGPLEVGTAGPDDLQHGIAVTLPLVRAKVLGQRRVQRVSSLDALRAAEARLHGALVLVDAVEAGQEVTDDEPGHEPEDDAHRDHDGWAPSTEVRARLK